MSLTSEAQPATILIVDDISTNLETLSECLEAAGFEVMAAQDGASGLTIAQRARPDLILLDVLMPGLDGFETCRRLKAADGTRDIPVVFMTALTETADKITGFEVGGVDYVTKPFQVEELLARVKTHLALRRLQQQLATQNMQLQHEIAERQRAEEKLCKYRDDLQASNAELAQYAQVVSHDLQAPLRAIHNYVGFLAEDLAASLTDTHHAYLVGLVRAAREAEELVKDLLELSRIGHQRAPTELVDLGVFLRTLISSLDLPADVEIAWGEDWPSIETEPTLLRQIFQNLILNAVKFNRSSPKRIALDWRSVEPERYELSVRDNGIGIAARYQAQIFQIFQRLHTQQEYEGTGVGLAIVQKAVSTLQGSVRVESTPGEGSTFLVTLPRESHTKSG